MRRRTPDIHEAKYEIDIRFLRVGRHSAVLFLPPPYHAPMGLVVAHWSHFEEVFDAILGALILAESQDGPQPETIGWELQKFAHRKRLFTDICKRWLHQYHSTAAAHLKELMARAADLHWQRNMLTHGRILCDILPHSSTATNVRAVNPKKPGAELPFTVDTLKRMYHDISHLTAELWIEFSKIGSAQGPVFLVEDKELLRIYRDTNHPWNPDPKKRTALP